MDLVLFPFFLIGQSNIVFVNLYLSALSSYTGKTWKILWAGLKRMCSTWRLHEESHASTKLLKKKAAADSKTEGRK